jgi:ubiquitin-protein ligase
MAYTDVNQEYNGQLSPSAIKRLMKERDSMGRDSLEGQGILFHFDDHASHKAVALILGPKGTPYAYGFYFFEFTFPNSYPQRPPHVVFCTGDGRVRFNPNLYVNGKVCLSILGTWEGPRWTQMCTFRTTLLSLQSLLCLKPIQNEPGYEQESGSDCDLYDAILRYENVNVAAFRMAGNLPPLFAPFRTTVGAVFLHQYPYYVQALAEFDNCEGKIDRCPIFNFITRYSPSTVRRSLANLRDALLNDAAVTAEFDRLAANKTLPLADAPRSAPSTGVSIEPGDREAPLLPPPARHVAHGFRVSQSCRRACEGLAQRIQACWSALNANVVQSSQTS